MIQALAPTDASHKDFIPIYLLVYHSVLSTRKIQHGFRRARRALCRDAAMFRCQMALEARIGPQDGPLYIPRHWRESPSDSPGNVMKLRHKALASAAALVMIGATASDAASSTTTVKSQFRGAVSRVLNSVRNDTEFLRSLSNADFRAFVSCAQDVMSAAPIARMQYVLAAGSNLGEQRRRFDQVALDDRAKLKQKITLECA